MGQFVRIVVQIAPMNQQVHVWIVIRHVLLVLDLLQHVSVVFHHNIFMKVIISVIYHVQLELCQTHPPWNVMVIINYIKDVQIIIIDCDTVCGTCSGTIDNCETCTKSPYLYLHENTCKDACPIGTIEFPSNVCAGSIHLCLKELFMC